MLAFFRVLFVLVLSILTYLLLMEMTPSPDQWPLLDKVQHIVSFGGLAGASLLAFPGRYKLVFMLTGAYGGLMEVMQWLFTTTRQASVYDWIADMIGVILAIGVLYAFRQWQEKRFERI